MQHIVSFKKIYKTRWFLVVCYVVLATSPSMLLLAKLAKTMCERLETRFVIKSFEDSMMQTKKLGR
jgi:uncharacterized membrane protein YqhA